MKKRKQHNKIISKTSHNNNIYNILTHRSVVVDRPFNYMYFIGAGCNKKNVKDNRHNYSGSGISDYHHGNTIRVPSLNKSNKIWKNFYMLFPHVYFNMRKNSIGKKDGDIVEIWINAWQKAKVKVISGLSIKAIPTKIYNNLYGMCLYEDEINKLAKNDIIYEISDKNNIN